MENSRARNNRIEMKNVNKDIVGWLEDVIEENNGIALQRVQLHAECNPRT